MMDEKKSKDPSEAMDAEFKRLRDPRWIQFSLRYAF